VDAAAAVARAVLRAAAEDLDLLLGDLRRWVSRDSPSGDAAAVDALAADIAERLGEAGADVELHPGPAGADLHATLRGAGTSRVALLCHHDTVFARGTAAQRPFALDGGVARGPGVADMKGGVVVAAHALRLLGAQDPARFGEVTLVSVPDEELRTEPLPALGRLGTLDAVLCMECGRPGNAIVTARKGAHWLSVAARGRAAHPGVAAARGRSALLAACREALRLAGLDGARDGLSSNVTTLQAGASVNAIPSEATLTVDLRAWRAADLAWAVDEAARFGDHHGVELSLAASRLVPPLERTPAVRRLAELAGEIARRMGTPIAEVATGGVSDACWTAAAGIPTLDGLGPVGQDDHSPGEMILTASLPERCGLVAGLAVAVESRVAAARAEELAAR
jgi:glutamate carboxypeptidase